MPHRGGCDGTTLTLSPGDPVHPPAQGPPQARRTPSAQCRSARARAQGSAFWATLGRVMPDYEQRRGDLRRAGASFLW